MIVPGCKHMHGEAAGVPLAVAFDQLEGFRELVERVVVWQPRTHGCEKRFVPDKIPKIHRSVEAGLFAWMGHYTDCVAQLENRDLISVRGVVKVRCITPPQQVKAPIAFCWPSAGVEFRAVGLDAPASAFNGTLNFQPVGLDSAVLLAFVYVTRPFGRDNDDERLIHRMCPPCRSERKTTPRGSCKASISESVMTSAESRTISLAVRPARSARRVGENAS